jgi:hypothetical protein
MSENLIHDNNNENNKGILYNTYKVKDNTIGIENVKEVDRLIISNVLHSLLEIHGDDKPKDIYVDSFENFYTCVATGLKAKVTVEELLLLRNLDDKVQDAYYDPDYRNTHGIVVKVYSITHDKYTNSNNINNESEIVSVSKKRKRGALGNFINIFWPSDEN